MSNTTTIYQPKHRTFNNHTPSLRRALTLLQEIFYYIVPNHASMLSTKYPGRSSILRDPNPNQPDQLVIPRSALNVFLETLLLRTSFDMLYNEAFYHEELKGLVYQNGEVIDFLFDIESRFYASWYATEQELNDVNNALMKILSKDMRNNDANFLDKLESELVYDLPLEVAVRRPRLDFWSDRIRSSKLLVILSLLHLAMLDQHFIRDIE